MIDLISNLEIISLNFPNKLLKLKGYVLRDNKKEYLEIIIYKGFSSSTTHPIEIDSEKKVIDLDYNFTKCELYKSPLLKELNKPIRENLNSLFFLDKKNWI